MQEWFIIILPAFILGILHTAIPCEDKVIFCFWSLGISKDVKHSLFILILYGLGLMSANLLIALVTIFISLMPRFIFPEYVPNPYAINFFGALCSMFAGIFILFFITRREYLPHSKYKDQIPQLNWAKKRTPYFFGILAGFPPCIFELIVYSQCLIFSLSYGFLEGILLVFYFSLGTFLGLFPLAAAKLSTSHIFKSSGERKNTILYTMTLIIIIFNVIIMILSFLGIHVFPVPP